MRSVLFTLFLLLLVAGSAKSQTYIGTDFRFSFLANIDPPFNGLPNFDIPIEAFENASITVEYGTPADAYYLSETITLNAGESGVVSFDQIFLNQNVTGVIENRSFHVVSTGDIRVYAFHNRAFFSDSTPVLPTISLKSDYMVLTKTDPDFVAPALYSVIATVDNTTVNFLNTGASINGAAGVPFSLTLNAGQVITIASVDGLSGSTVTSDPDKPIAVFAGNKQAEISVACGADNHLYEQLHPTEYWGTVHPLIRVPVNIATFTRIIALEDNTDVYVGCTLIATLNSGEVFEGSTSFIEIIRSTRPVLVALFTDGFECINTSTGDPNMRFLQPLDKANLGYKLQTNSGFQQNLPGAEQITYLNLAMPTDQTDLIQVDGAPVVGWAPFISTPNFSYVTVVVNDISTQTLNVQSAAPFWSEFISLSPADAMTMSMGTTATMEVPNTELLIANLGPDQTICEGQTIVLDPELGLTGTWQDGSEQETYTVTEPGTYSVQLDGACDSGFDEIIITISDAAPLDLPETYNLCVGSQVEIGVDNNTDIDYEWSTGAETSQITVTNSGEYTLTASIDGFCEATQSTNVVLQLLPELSIDGPSEICIGNEAVLIASGDAGNFEWADGTLGSTLTIMAPGTYAVTLTNNLGCASTESITVITSDGPQLEIQGPESICESGNETLVAVGDEGDLVWNNQTTAATLSIGSPGNYSVTLTAPDGCTSTASISVGLLPAPTISVSNVSFCAGKSRSVTAATTGESVTWPNFSTTATIVVSESGVYQAVAENECGQTFKNVVFTAIDCTCEVYVPNAFTPNGDGLNDLFFPQIGCQPEGYAIEIYNRWGTIVFQSTDFSEKWNGNSPNDQDYYDSDGVYFYLIEYINPLLPPMETIQIRGSVMLLR